MRLIRIISKGLKGLAIVLALVYGLSFIYCAFVMLLHTLVPAAPWVPFEEFDDRFVVLFPFTDVGFITERLHWGSQLLVLVILGSYSLFFYLLGRLFAAFSQEKLFTGRSVEGLKRFSWLSLSLPVLVFLFYALVTNEAGMGEVLLLIAHLLLGVFAFFLLAIFQEGYHLQQEQDLTI